MNLRTYTAATFAAALAQVRKDLGPEAVVLHTRTYQRGGILGFGGRQVVEITAADRAVAGASRRRAAGSAPPPRRAAGPGGSAAAPVAASPSAGDLIRRTYAVAQAEFARRAAQAPGANRPAKAEVARLTRAAPPSAPALTASAPATVAPVGPGHDQLAQELRAVKRMVEDLVQQQKQRQGPRQPDLPDTLFDQYLNLLRHEVTEELAEEIVQQVQAALRPEQLGRPNQVRQAVLEQVAKLIPVDESAGQAAPTPDGRPRTIALIGPTGVGKTTTVAKLAAGLKLRQGRNVGLITLDTYRIAAVDQLRTYANIIGVPLHVAASPNELAEAAARCARCDVVLIDTAGRSQRDDPRLEQLGALLRAADPHEVHLVLSSTCTQAVLLEAVERFSRIRTDRIIFTKLDEAVSFGVILNVARKVNKRLSFVTTGQEVPHHIEPGRSRRLAALVLGEEAGSAP